MYQLILGAVVSQIFSAIIARYGLPMVKYHLMLILYKSKFRKMANEQMKKHAQAF